MSQDKPDTTLTQESSPGTQVPGDAASPSPAENGPDGGASPSLQTAPEGAPATEPAADGQAGDTPEANHADQVAGDLDELVKVAAERDEYLALAQRTQADFENYRKRMAREAAAAEARGKAKLVKELLPALDNLERALDAAADDDPLLDGVRLVHNELVSALGRMGVESYSPKGERFDPVEQEAMAQQSVDGVEPGTVVDVYQSGYRLNGVVIRPARVVVAA